MSGTEITINGPAGSFMAYKAVPANPNGAAVVVIQEIFGVNAVVRAIADEYAARGYVAYAPDLFWRIEPGVNITDKSEAEWKKAFDLYSKFSVDGGVEDIGATIAHARADGAKAVGAVGYCLGGLLAFLTATRTDANAAVGYYGVGIEGFVSEAQSLAKPLMLHIAEEDGFVSKDAQSTIKTAVAGNASIAVYSYPGLDHAFARIGGEHYDEAGATLANSRTADFFATHLA